MLRIIKRLVLTIFSVIIVLTVGAPFFLIGMLGLNILIAFFIVFLQIPWPNLPQIATPIIFLSVNISTLLYFFVKLYKFSENLIE